MKSKTASILFILAIIAGIHVIGIFFFMKSGKDGKSPSPQTTARTEAENSAIAKAEEEIKKKVEEKAKDVPPLPYDYSLAVNGNIPELPQGAVAKSGILVDINTRKVLWAKNAKEGVPIASMTKMMTLLIAMEDVRNEKVSLSTDVKVTKHAYKIGGSQVYLDPRETFKLEDLLKTIAIKSANDSAYLVSEFLGGGDVESFISRMNQKAEYLNMPNTKFFNAHGLPGTTSKEDNISSAEGMAILAEVLLRSPKIVEWASTPTFTFREGTDKPMLITNHNKLVNECPGVDGMKTGFINRSGFCITVTCKRADRRLIAVVTGFNTWKDRNSFVKKLIDWGYRRAPLVESGKVPPPKAAEPVKKAATSKKTSGAKSKK
ncbi:MAG: hypothetical protein A2020_14605 [Lentisphaerae bacterium GWF2_45_14]|nr:MAG: hypothetical protein A2020_14605 [Lentisphaerae bacterium GWF2_45_14]